MKFYIFTVWIQDNGGDFDARMRRVILRLPGRTDHPNHEDIKGYVIAQTSVRSPDARVEFGPFSESKRQN